MTKQQIIAELRRSAVEDADPWAGLSYTAFRTVYYNQRVNSDPWAFAKPDHLRTFLLLVAEALND